MTPCVYLTIYSGNKLPPFYIGSSTVEKVNSGYFGSVKSLEYKSTWKEETAKNPHLFECHVISTHPTKKAALAREEDLQRKLNVVKNPLYINKSYACKNGIFGRVGSGQTHHSYGKRGNEVGWFGIKRSDKSKERYKISKSGDKNPGACVYQIFDDNNTLIMECKGNFVNNAKAFIDDAATIRELIKSYKTSTKLKHHRKGKTGPLPSWDKKYEGWYATRSMPKHRVRSENSILGRNWFHNPNSKDEVMVVSCPKGWLPGRNPATNLKISQAKNSTKSERDTVPLSSDHIFSL